MRKILYMLAILTVSTSVQARHKESPAPAPVDVMVLGRPAEIVVKDAVLANDKDLKGKQLYEPKFVTASDGRNGAYVAMTAAFGDVKACGPRYTWLYHAYGKQVHRMFRYPFNATQIAGGASPVVRGDYWAYECLVCDNPENGYMEQIPVKIFRQAFGWKIVPEVALKDRPRIAREAHLIVESAMSKYGDKDPEARRMLQQISRLLPLSNAPVAQTAPALRKNAPQLSQQPGSNRTAIQ